MNSSRNSIVLRFCQFSLFALALGLTACGQKNESSQTKATCTAPGVMGQSRVTTQTTLNGGDCYQSEAQASTASMEKVEGEFANTRGGYIITDEEGNQTWSDVNYEEPNDPSRAKEAAICESTDFAEGVWDENDRNWGYENGKSCIKSAKK